MKSSEVAKAAKAIRLSPKGVSVRAMKAVYTAIGLHLPNPQPSQQTLADITGYDVRVVKRAIAALEDQGFLSHQRVGKRESNAYVMGLPEVPSGDGTFSTSDGTFCGGDGTPRSHTKGSLEGKPKAAAEAAAAANLSWEGESKSQLAAALGLHPGSLHALRAAIRSDAYLADLEHDPARLVEVWGRKALRSARAAAEADTARRRQPNPPSPADEPPRREPRTTRSFASIVAQPPAASEAADPDTTPADPDTTNQDRHPSQYGLRAIAV